MLHFIRSVPETRPIFIERLKIAAVAIGSSPSMRAWQIKHSTYQQNCGPVRTNAPQWPAPSYLSSGGRCCCPPASDSPPPEGFRHCIKRIHLYGRSSRLDQFKKVALWRQEEHQSPITKRRCRYWIGQWQAAKICEPHQHGVKLRRREA